jgi:hypothetical protein
LVLEEVFVSLTPAEIQALTAALYDGFPTRNDLELLLVFLGKRIEDYVTSSMAGALPYAAVVVAASRAGWVAILLQQARTMRDTNQLLLAFENQYRSTGFPLPADPYCAPVLRAKRPFIDRQGLRDRMAELASAGASRVLVVEGERYSGKSYTRFLVEHLARNPGGFRQIVVDLIEDAITKPDELAHTLVMKMGGDPVSLPIQGVTTAARYGLILAAAVQSEVNRLGSHIWVVFDGLARPGVLPETIELVLDIAKRAELEVPELRVILLELPVTLPPEVDSVALREVLHPIDAALCVEWLETVHSLLNVSWGKAELLEEVSKMFKSLPESGDPDRLKTLSREAWKLANRKPPVAPAAPQVGGDQ